MAEFVEPVQLQVVCQTLWDGLKPDETQITAKHLKACGDADRALAAFYDRCVREAAQQSGVREGEVRRWFEEKLITRANTRGMVFRGPSRTGSLPNETVDLLEGMHLVRSENRGGGVWYELTHDRFIEPIRQSNRRWRAGRSVQTLQALQHKATIWNHDRTPRNLLSESDLIDAETWMNSSDAIDLGMSDLLVNFLRECRVALDLAKADAERREAERRTRRLFVSVALWTVSSIVVVVVLIAMLKKANFWKSQSDIAADKAKVQAESLAATMQLAKNPEKGVRMAIGAAELSLSRPELDEVHATARQSLRRALLELRQRSRIAGSSEVKDVAFCPDGRLVAVADKEGFGAPLGHRPARRSRRRPPGGHAGSPPERGTGQSRPVRPRRHAPAGRRRGPEPEEGGGRDRLGADRDTAGAVASEWSFDRHGPGGPCRPRGRGGVQPGRHARRDREHANRRQGSIDRRRAGLQHDVRHALSPWAPSSWTGRPTASRSTGTARGSSPPAATSMTRAAGAPGRAVVLAVHALSEAFCQIPGYDSPVARAVFSPDGSLVAAGCKDGVTRVFCANDGRPIATLIGHTQAITDLNFSPDGALLVTASGDRKARVWDTGKWLSTPDRPRVAEYGHPQRPHRVGLRRGVQPRRPAGRDLRLRQHGARLGRPLGRKPAHAHGA